MNADELYDRFRDEVVDLVAPFLWSEDNVWAYMNDAYRMFARLTDGIPDSTSKLTLVPITAGEKYSKVSPLILKFRTAFLQSTGRELGIINDMDRMDFRSIDGYGYDSLNLRDDTPGQVRHVVTGVERNALTGKVRWIRVPMEDDVCELSVFRLPLDVLASGSELTEIGYEHHEHLLLWMKARAYSKQDADAFDRGKRNENKAAFEGYCEFVKGEWARYKTTTSPMAYGGI